MGLERQTVCLSKTLKNFKLSKLKKRSKVLPPVKDVYQKLLPYAQSVISAKNFLLFKKKNSERRSLKIIYHELQSEARLIV